MKMLVKAISSFEHGGSRRRGDEFEVSDRQAEQLEGRRLVKIIGPAEVQPAAEGSGSGVESTAADQSKATKTAASRRATRG
ncbi:hypothetical protein [Bordetella bronchiseptica]|uniref:hypothetical protein n=1 Tax=Bordetella bronchiseptica TaxID=518 RepID=UPI00123A22BF|nr:hypothetical protein [Bordetella bronchiseptica]QET71435.1 hypothetical protein FOB42_14435 [Bordetella bronchiseptica]